MDDCLDVYVDDSGTDPKSQIASAAFCVFTPEKKVTFEQAWRKIADRAGFDLQAWHMAEFAACRLHHPCQQCTHSSSSVKEHPWRQWPDAKRENVLRRMAKSLVENVECAWGLAHTKEDYQTYIRDSPARALADEPIGDEHVTFAVQQCGSKLAAWRATESKQNVPLKFIFDNSSPKQRREIAQVFLGAANNRAQYEGGIEQWFEQVDITFESRKRVPQLLSADMIAWTVATIRAREMFRAGRLQEVFQLGYVFTGDKAKHLRIGYTDRSTFIDWEKKIMNSTVPDLPRTSPIKNNRL